MANERLVIVDDEYVEAAKKIVDLGIDLKYIIDNYISILNYMTVSGDNQGKLADALANLSIIIERYPAIIQDITNELYNEMSNYISDIDDADEFLF